jgi:plastocyanin
MAVSKSTVLVNGGNTGWTKSDVISAMEVAFANLGWHSGTAKTGVPTTCFAPGSTVPYNESTPGNWRWAAPSIPVSYYRYQRNYYVTNSGNSSWNIKRSEQIDYYYGTNYTPSSRLRLYDIADLPTGTAVVYSDEGGLRTPPQLSGGGNAFVNGQTYYIIAVDDDWVQIATTESNALNGIFIELQAGGYSGNFGYFDIDLGTNPTLICRQGDNLNFTVNATGHPFYIQDQTGAYNPTRLLNNTNFRSITYRDFPQNQGIENGILSWEIDAWGQGDYHYVCQLHPSMNGIIRVLPSPSGFFNQPELFPYWDYTVPANGVPGKTDLQLRVWRDGVQNNYYRQVNRIEILNQAEGWSNDEVFTIPGSAIGGVSPTHDINFGVNSATTQQQNDNSGVASLRVTNIGAGSNFYQKWSDGAILRLENDANKTYGTTYFGIRFNNNDYQIGFLTGSQWDTLGWDPSSTTYSRQGRFGGVVGLDKPSIWNGALDQNTELFAHYNIATSATPTQYPLRIVVHRATSPQDTNFATITFVQTINSIDYSYLTFSLLKGPSVGNGVWDLNYVWNGSWLVVSTGSEGGEAVRLETHFPYETYGSLENNSGNSLRRESFFGYRRDQTNENTNRFIDYYTNNIYGLSGDSSQYKTGYYRNSSYDDYQINQQNSTNYNINDAIQTVSVSSSADYYRPFKGIPLNTNMMPCPYYLPDDFTIIQFSVTPGATAFRVGDTITVSGSEIYEIVQVYYTTNNTALDGIADNTSKGIAFCARTT